MALTLFFAGLVPLASALDVRPRNRARASSAVTLALVLVSNLLAQVLRGWNSPFVLVPAWALWLVCAALVVLCTFWTNVAVRDRVQDPRPARWPDPWAPRLWRVVPWLPLAAALFVVGIRALAH